MFIIVSRSESGRVRLRYRDEDAEADGPSDTFGTEELPRVVSEREQEGPRWVWDDTRRWYPGLLAHGVKVNRCHDLRLCHTILRHSASASDSALSLAAASPWDELAENGVGGDSSELADGQTALFQWRDGQSQAQQVPDEAAEFERQQRAVEGSSHPARLRLLLAAESVGALIAVEMHHAGLPWRTEIHDRLLTELAGPRTLPGTRPARLERLADDIRSELGAPGLNPDSPAGVLRALQRAGVMVTSTRSWELTKVVHPVIRPLLEYKKLSRLLAANGWAWMDSWVHDGRFRADYVPGAVVTGRWAARGGGALQLPKQVRGAVVADDGWKLVVADAAQLEPRVLAGLSGDIAMAGAGRGKDLYAGIVDSGVVPDRPHAKVAMLGAMYGATTGESGRLMPALARAYPKAIALVEAAARAGERGEVVTSRLGRSSPKPSANWRNQQARASLPTATAADERTARSQARDWGRFTRNFIVQSSAAEWALCWMAGLRKRLGALGNPGGRLIDGPHLVYFLHDEVIVHTPAELADQVVTEVIAAATAAGGLLFGNFPVAFPVTAVAVENYGQAK